jgi:hypothetical protein
MSRRLQGITVSVEMVGDLARAKGTVPQTATFNHAYFDHSRNAFVCYFEDVTFAEVAEAGIIPIDVPDSNDGF